MRVARWNIVLPCPDNNSGKSPGVPDLHAEGGQRDRVRQGVCERHVDAGHQVIILPIADRHEAYARELDAMFKAAGLRSAVDGSREKIGKKIREAEVQKVPLILVVGDKEVERRTASLRVHGQGDKGEVEVAGFIEKVRAFDAHRTLHTIF